MPSSKARPLRCLDTGEGLPLVLLHGYAMQPETYLPLAQLLADRVRVVIPAIFALPEPWSFEHALECLELTLGERGVERMSLLGHSFGGGLELGFAARHPERVVECVFGDTLGDRREFRLAEEALRNPLGLLRMASVPAATAFFRSFTTHPLQLVRAAWWGFTSDRKEAIDAIVAAGIPCHVLWAERDTLLLRSDGQAFARDIQATFTVATPPPGYGRIDHDWMFDDPELFAAHLEELGLQILALRRRRGRVEAAQDVTLSPHQRA
ncbi:MAG TPA: alpha/beta hydrolase [Candidatus Binatus sp.]|jgi:pimeloyl-ACP methyl ester carboxylesterase|nr:alpha/beta hydrolase [Candidatus Binatus sp.]